MIDLAHVPASAEPSSHVRWPAGRFYWAVLDASSLPRRPGRSQLDYLFERGVPVAIEDVHAAYVRLGKSRRFLACGLDKDSLNEVIASNNSVRTLTPGSLPAFLTSIDGPADGIERVDPDDFNLLTGPFQPPAVRRLKRRAIVEAAISVAALLIIIVFGQERRIHLLQNRAQQLLVQRSDMITSALGASSAPASLPPDVQLVSELRTLRQTRRVELPVAADADTATILSAVLSRWPDDVHLLTQSIAVAPKGITIRGSVPTVADAQGVIDSFRGDGWLMQQPSIRNAKNGVDLEVRLTSTPTAVPGRGITP